MPQITARDTASGKTVTFNWNGDASPTDADMAEVFKAAAAQPSPARVTPVSESEPGSFWSGAAKGFKDYVREGLSGLRPMLEQAAHPQSAGDFATLLLPATGLGMGLRSLKGWGSAAKNLGEGMAEGAADREGLKKLPAIAKGAWNVATDTVSGRDRAFQKLPLADQMHDLPETPAPMRTRSSGPPMSEFNPNDVPLAQRPFHAEQLRPDRGALAGGPLGWGRTNTPPFQSQTPFHELPLYQQMAQMADTPGGVGTSRVGMPVQSAPTQTGLTLKAVEDAIKANKLSPDAATKLLKQIQMSQLTKIGPE